MSNPWYREYADFLALHFPGRKMQKLSIDAGFTCPNRDGTVGRGGCAYCNVASFSPVRAMHGESIRTQIERSREFFAGKYRDMGYLAYFQSYTGTHAPLQRLIEMFNEALEVESVEGIVIGTRPDCVSPELIDRLGSLGKFVMIEYGAESSHDATLRRVNRCHTWADTVRAVNLAREGGIPVGLHLIMGLPGETREDMLATVDAVNLLPVDVVKIHQLQILKGTAMALWPETVRTFTVDEYLDLCVEIVSRLRDDIAIDRFVSQAPAELLIAPRWGLKNYQFTNLLHNKLREIGKDT